ncbi:MAG: hypothetical protein R3229_16390 [Alphaproteobacteria bacterium]|nr:hypothetical protein [Alphaproteobacteria bacterium]
MTAPEKYGHIYSPVKFFLTSYRALSDGKIGVRHLDEFLKSERFGLSDWKVIWIGTCALLRTSIELLQADTKSCISDRLREEIGAEWRLIKKNKEEHQIFWQFLRRERNNILHEYEWAAYEMWMDQEGATRPAEMGLLSIRPEDVDPVLIMRGGPYRDQNSLDLLKESAAWAEDRIFSAIRRAGFDPDEERNLHTFEERPPDPPGPKTPLTDLL